MGEFLKRRFADAAGCSYEDGDEVGGRVLEMRELEVWTTERETMFDY